MTEQDIALYALVEGIPTASKTLRLRPEMLMLWIRNANLKSKLFATLTEHIIAVGVKETPKAAAKKFGIPEKLVVDILKKYLTETVNLPNNAIYPYNSYEKFTQTCFQPSPNWKTMSVQTDSPDIPPANEDRKTMKQYTIKDKIRAIKECQKHMSQAAASRDMNIPTASLIRWRDKLKNVAFQETHYSLIYADKRQVKRDSILNELDLWLFEWFNKNKGHIQKEQLDHKLREKATKMIQLDDVDPEISEKWLEGFKEHFNI